MRKIEDDYLPQGEHIAVESYCKKPDNLIPIFVNQEIKKSVNTPQQWACKFDAFLFNEYEFTQEELDELQADRQRQIRRETS